jgi:hypothetical protein
MFNSWLQSELFQGIEFKQILTMRKDQLLNTNHTICKIYKGYQINCFLDEQFHSKMKYSHLQMKF